MQGQAIGSKVRGFTREQDMGPASVFATIDHDFGGGCLTIDVQENGFVSVRLTAEQLVRLAEELLVVRNLAKDKLNADLDVWVDAQEAKGVTP